MTYMQLLFEPVFFGCLAWACLTFLLWRKRLYWRFSLASLLLFWLFASPAGANLLAWSLERHYQQPQLCEGFAADTPIVVLGGGKRGETTRPDAVETLLQRSLVRVFSAMHLWDHLGGKSLLIVSGGGDGPVREADLMASLLSRAGVPDALLVRERDSMNTRENGAGVYKILQRRQINRLYLVTSAMHMPRAMLVFGEYPLQICPWPVDQRAFMPDWGGMLLPSIRPLEKSTAAWHEILGLVWYSLTGSR